MYREYCGGEISQSLVHRALWRTEGQSLIATDVIGSWLGHVCLRVLPTAGFRDTKRSFGPKRFSLSTQAPSSLATISALFLFFVARRPALQAAATDGKPFQACPGELHICSPAAKIRGGGKSNCLPAFSISTTSLLRFLGRSASGVSSSADSGHATVLCGGRTSDDVRLAFGTLKIHSEVSTSHREPGRLAAWRRELSMSLGGLWPATKPLPQNDNLYLQSTSAICLLPFISVVYQNYESPACRWQARTSIY